MRSVRLKPWINPPRPLDAQLVELIETEWAAEGRWRLEERFLSREKHVLMPIALIADVDREAAEVVLAVSADDVARMKRPEAADFVIELQSRLAY